MNRLASFSSGANQVPGQGQPAAPSWDARGPETPTEQWRYQRRGEIGQFAIPFVLHQLRDGQLTAAEDWRPDPSADQLAKDKAIIDRAVSLATLLQQAIDRARPRA